MSRQIMSISPKRSEAPSEQRGVLLQLRGQRLSAAERIHSGTRGTDAVARVVGYDDRIGAPALARRERTGTGKRADGNRRGTEWRRRKTDSVDRRQLRMNEK